MKSPSLHLEIARSQFILLSCVFFWGPSKNVFFTLVFLCTCVPGPFPFEAPFLGGGLAEAWVVLAASVPSTREGREGAVPSTGSIRPDAARGRRLD